MKKQYSALFIIFFCFTFQIANAQCVLTQATSVNPTPGQCDGRVAYYKNGCLSLCGFNYTSSPSFPPPTQAIMSETADSIIIDSLCALNYTFDFVCGFGTMGVSFLTAINNNDLNVRSFTLSGNGNGILKINYSQPVHDAFINVYDATGRLLLKSKAIYPSQEIDLSSHFGIYLVSFQDKDVIHSGTIVLY